MSEGFQGTNRFQLLDRVGAGGSGLVYLAHDHKRNLNVALKTLHRESPYGILRLKNEFRGLAQISHPNLAKLHDLHHDADTWFFTMEYVKGIDFIQWVRPHAEDEPDPEWLRLRAALEQLVIGVSAIHMAGHLHRDIKPSNLMVEPSGRVVVLDFGLATRADQIDVRDIRGFSGTLEYMAPEQTDGGDPLPESDWYSVGVVLFEALTGELPFKGKPLQVAINKKQLDGPAPSSINPDVPPDLDELCEGLMRRNPEERLSEEDIFALLEIEPDESIMLQRGSAASTAMPRLIGRESQMGALVSALAEVKHGRTVLCSVHGQSGMGKSALVRNFIYPLRRQADVMIIRGRCYEREAVPYNAFDSVFDDLTRKLGALPSELVKDLVPENIAALTRLFPVLLNVAEISVAVSALPHPSQALTSRQAAFEAARDLLARIAERWVLVVHIDDVHWGDSDSASFLQELLHLSGPPKALFLCSFHTEEMHGSEFVRPLRFLVARSSPEFEGREIEVGPINVEQGRSLVRHLLDGRPCSERYVDQIVQESAGCPYFIEALVAQVGDGRPSLGRPVMPQTGALTLNAVIGTRLEALGPDALRLLQVIVVTGRPIARSVALEVCGFGPEGERALGLLRAEHLVRVRMVDDEEYFETYHDRVRETVQAGLSSQIANQLNRAIAVALERRSQDAPESFVDHFIQAGEFDRARQYLTESAGRADDKLAFERAAGLFSQALDIHRQSVTLPASDLAREEERELLIHLGQSLENSGKAHRASKIFIEAASQAPDRQRRELQMRAAVNLMISGSIRDGLRLLKTVVDELSIPYLATAAAALPSLHDQRTTLKERGTEFSLTSGVIDEHLLERIDVCWMAAIGLGAVDYVRAAEFHVRALLMSLESGDAYRIARSLAMESINAAAKAPLQMRRADTLSAAAHALAQQLDHPHALGLSLYGRGVCHLLAARWSAAQTDLSAAAQVFRERCQSANWERASTHTMLFSALAMQGDFRLANERVPEFLEAARANHNTYLATNMRTGFAGLSWLAMDDPNTAERLHDESVRILKSEQFQIQHHYLLITRVNLDLYQGRHEGTLSAVMSLWSQAEIALVDKVNFVRMDLLTLRIRAALGGLCAGHEEERARRILERDLSELEHCGIPWGQAVGALLAGRYAELQGETAGAIQAYEKGISELANCGLHGWSAAARMAYGQARGGAAGSEAWEQGCAAMQARGVRNPERMVRTYIPGLTSHPGT